MSSKNDVVRDSQLAGLEPKASGVDAPFPVARVPYVGPRPFEAEDRSVFFGREREIDEIASLVVAHPVVVLYGRCGAGKTSLLNAGVLPELDNMGLNVRAFVDANEGEVGGHAAPFSRLARVRGPLPTNLTPDQVKAIPNVFVFNTITSLMGKDADIPYLLKSGQDFKGFLERQFPLGKQEKPLVVVFDQFEEIFTPHAADRQLQRDFFKQLGAALKADQVQATDDTSPDRGLSLRVVIAMREEALSHLESYAWQVPGELRIRYPLEGLRERAALQAVRRPVLEPPAASFPEEAAEELVKRLRKSPTDSASGDLGELLDEFVEPMHLQLSCQKLWLRCQQEWEGLPQTEWEISRESVEKYVAVKAVLEEFYDDTVREVASSASVPEWRLREWCEKLISREGTRSAVVQDSKTTHGIPNTVVQKLDRRHLVRSEERSGGVVWYELTHDRFIDVIKESNEKHGIPDRREKLKDASLSIVVLALSDLRLADFDSERMPVADKAESVSGKAPCLCECDPVETLQKDEVEFFFWLIVGSNLPHDEKYQRLIRLFELQEFFNRKLLEEEGPEDYTPEGMQKLVSTVAQREGVWNPASIMNRTQESIQQGIKYLQDSRQPGGWKWCPRDDGHPRLWPTGHALMALCAARDIVNGDEDIPCVPADAKDLLLQQSHEWCVDSFPPPQGRGVYEVGIGLMTLACLRREVEHVFDGNTLGMIERTLSCLCRAQNENGGWDYNVWRDGQPDRKWSGSDVGATSLAIQGLVAWTDLGTPDMEQAIRRGVEWLAGTQNDDGSWNNGRCETTDQTNLSGDPRVTKTCDAIRGIRAGTGLHKEPEAISKKRKATIDKALKWIRRQERSFRTESGANAIGWAEDHTSGERPDPITTCITLETLVQLDNVPVPLFTANAQWLMDSQDSDPNSPTYGAWVDGDTFRSTLCLIEYYKKIRSSPFFAPIDQDATGDQTTDEVTMSHFPKRRTPK